MSSIRSLGRSLIYQKAFRGASCLRAIRSYAAQATDKADAVGYRILSIDGGGIRGIIPGMVLKAIETMAGVPICRLFDFIGGTSTGGILSLAAVTPESSHSSDNRHTAKDGVETYTAPGMSKRIFSKPVTQATRTLKTTGMFTLVSISTDSSGGKLEFDTNLKDLPFVRPIFLNRYSEKQLETVYKEKFGEIELKDALCDLLITSVDVRTQQPYYFTRKKARTSPQHNFPLWKVARATSAAPTFFNPIEMDGMLLVDGGMVENNPSFSMIANALGRGVPIEALKCISLGTGHFPITMNTHGYGMLPMAFKVYDLVSTTASSLADDQCRELLGEERYHRFQAQLTRNIPLDATEEAVIDELTIVGNELVESNMDQLSRLCEELLAIGEKREGIE